MGRASPCCQECKGTGIISRPYMVGLLGGDLYTMSVCPCTKDPADPKPWKEPRHD